MTTLSTLLLALLLPTALTYPTPSSTSTTTQLFPHDKGSPYIYNGLIPFVGVACPTTAFSSSTINAVFANATSPGYDYGSKSFTTLTNAQPQYGSKIPQNWAPGCDTTKLLAYIEIGTSTTLANIVVFAVDTVGKGITYCGIMTKVENANTDASVYTRCDNATPSPASGAPAAAAEPAPWHPAVPNVPNPNANP